MTHCPPVWITVGCYSPSANTVEVDARALPFFCDTHEGAQRVAARLAGALREEKIEMAPVATIPTELATELLDAVDHEREESQDMYYDDTPRADEPEVAEYIKTLSSVRVSGDGMVRLDADQAFAVMDVLSNQISTREDLSDDRSVAPLYALARILQSAGYGSWTGPTWAKRGYRVELVDSDELPFEVYYQNKLLKAVPRSLDVYGVLEEHYGPEVGTQGRLV